MGNTVSAYGALLGLLLTIGLILKKVQPTYAMIIGAIVGGLIGGVSLERSIGFMITGIPSIVPAVIRVITAGVLVGTLIESGAAERIALTIIDKLGHERCLVALMLSTWALTAIGVFGDVACLAVAPIAIQVSERTGFKKMGVLMAMIGGVKAGGAISPNPNTIAAAETFKIPLTSLMLTGFAASLTALVATTFLSKYLAHKGSSFPHIDPLETSKVLPSLWSSLFGPGVAILLLLLRPIVGINVDPLVALPLGGFTGMIAMGKFKHATTFLSVGMQKMSGVAMLILGTGTLAGIISNSNLKDVVISGIETAGLPAFMLAPIAGMFMGAATASATAGATLGSQIFGHTIIAGGVSSLAGATMVNAGSLVFDGLPQGPFFHVSAKSVDMDIKERLKVLGFEILNGLAMVTVSTLLFGALHLAG